MEIVRSSTPVDHWYEVDFGSARVLVVADDAWEPRPPAPRSRALESHASRLRIKLDPEYGRYVVNCWGIGYRLIEG
jgi:DNA-binding response OmpR family regulator